MSSKTKPRQWGSVIERPGREGFYCRFSWQRKQYTRYAAATQRAAYKKLRKIHTLLDEGVPVTDSLAAVFNDFAGHRMSFREAGDQYLEYAKARKRPSTLAEDRCRMGMIKRTPWSAQYLSQVQPRDLNRWVAALVKDEKAGGTINRYLALVSAVYKWAIRMEYAERNPALARHVERMRESSGSEVYLSPPECHVFMDACTEAFLSLALAAIHTGMRRGELVALRWRSVDLQRAEVLVEADTEKAGRGRVVGIRGALLAHMRLLRASLDAPALDGSDLVFTRSGGRPWTKAAVRYQFQCARRRARDLPLAKREALRFHDLRHTAASLFVAAGVPIFDVSKTLGHSSVVVTMRYAHFAPEAAQTAAEKLDALLASSAKAKGRQADAVG